MRSEELDNLLVKFEKGIIGKSILVDRFRSSLRVGCEPSYPLLLQQELKEADEKLSPIKRLAFAICQMEGDLSVEKNPQKAYNTYRDLAGSLPLARCLLGFTHHEGVSGVCKQSDEEAFKILNDTRSSAHPLGQYYLGLLYSDKNEEKLISHHKNAARQGCIPALCYLIHHYREKGDYQEATHWIRKLAEFNDDVSSRSTAGYYLLFEAAGKIDKRRTPEEQAEGIRWLEESAHQDFLDACVYLATFYKEIRPPQPEKEYFYQEKAAKLGHAHAQNWVGGRLLLNNAGEIDGNKVNANHADVATALSLFKRSAAQKNKKACIILAVFYEFIKDKENEFLFRVQAAELGDAWSQHWVGCELLLDDTRRRIDPQKMFVNGESAAKWLKKAADNGIARACAVLALYHGCLRDYGTALAYEEKAVELGDIESMYKLGNKLIRETGRRNAARGILLLHKVLKLGGRYSVLAESALDALALSPRAFSNFAAEDETHMQRLADTIIQKRLQGDKLIVSYSADYLFNNQILFYFLTVFRKKYENVVTHLEIREGVLDLQSSVPRIFGIIELTEIITTLLTPASKLRELALPVHPKMIEHVLPELSRGVTEAKYLARLKLSGQCFLELIEGKPGQDDVVSMMQTRRLNERRLVDVERPLPLESTFPLSHEANSNSENSNNLVQPDDVWHEYRAAELEYEEKKEELGDAEAIYNLGCRLVQEVDRANVARGILLLYKAVELSGGDDDSLAQVELIVLAFSYRCFSNLVAENEADMQRLADTIIQKRLQGDKLIVSYNADYLFSTQVLFYFLTVFRQKYENIVTHLEIHEGISEEVLDLKSSAPKTFGIIELKKIIATLLTSSSKLRELALPVHPKIIEHVLPELSRGVTEAKCLARLKLSGQCFELKGELKADEIDKIIRQRILGETKLVNVELPPPLEPAVPFLQGAADQRADMKDKEKGEHAPMSGVKRRPATLFQNRHKKPKTEIEPVSPSDIGRLQRELRKNIATVRAGNDCQSNCNSLASHLFEVIGALLSGRPPSTEPVTTERQDNDTYLVTTEYKRLKPFETGEYKGAPITQVIRSWVNAPPWLHHYSFAENMSTGELEYDREILVEPNKKRIENSSFLYEILDNQLQEMARIRGEALYGSITLTLAGASARRYQNDHVIVFYATATDLFYIDAQNYNGIENSGEPIFTAIKSLDFAQPGQANNGRYGPICFYAIEGFVKNPSPGVSAQLWQTQTV
jgi:TPR repeat protein